MAYDIRFNVEQTGADSIDQITSKMTVMQARVASTAAELKKAAYGVADAQKQVSEGATNAAAGLKKQQDALDSLVVKQRLQKAALDAEKEALDALTPAVNRASAAHAAMVPQVAAASAAIRTFEGAMPIRAVERFAVNVLGLGPLLQAAFPIVGLIAFGEVIGRTLEKFDPFIQAEKKLEAQTKTLDKTFEDLGKRLDRLHIRRVTEESGAEKGQELAAFLATGDAASLRTKATTLNPQIQKAREDSLAATKEAREYDKVPLTGMIVAEGYRRIAAGHDEDVQRLEDQQAALRQEADVEEAEANADLATAKKDAGKEAAEKARAEAARRKSEVKRVESMERSGIVDPVARAYMKANDDVQSFTDPDLRARAVQAGISDASKAGLQEFTKVKKELSIGREEQETKRRETDKRADETFRKSLNQSKEKLSAETEAANKVKTFQNALTTESTSAAVRANAAKGTAADKIIDLSPQLTDSQKIAALNQQDLATARQKYQIEREGAAALLGDDERVKANNRAQLDFEDEKFKIQQENAERIAALEAKNIEEFRGLIGGLFDAVASRQPRAIPNFLKSQALNLGKTVVENAAAEYILPQLSKMTPHANGGPLAKLLKGTPFGADPLKTTAAPALVLAAQQLQGAASALRASRTGGGTGSGGGGTGFGGSGSGELDSGNDDYSGLSGGGIGDNEGDLAGLDPLPLGRDSGMNASANLSLGGGAGSGFGFNAGTIASVGAAAGAAFVAAKDFSKGGASGALSGIGAIAGGAAALDPEPVSKAILAVAAIALPLIGGLFDGPVRRMNAINTELGKAQYNAPVALNATQSSSGMFTDFDARGNIRTSNFSAIPQVREGSTFEQTHGLFGGPPTFYTVPGQQTSQFGALRTPPPPAPPVTINVNAIDTQSGLDFIDRNHVAIGGAAAKSMQNIHGALTTEVQRAANS